MATYPIDQLMIEYGNERMTVEMTTGHCLQHIKLLYEALDTSNSRRHEIRDKVATLEKELQALHDRARRQQTQAKQREARLKEQLTVLKLTVAELTTEVDNLKRELTDSAQK